MEKYFILEDNLERLTKKVPRIKNKCAKYDLDFAFTATGNVEYRTVTTADGDQITAKFVEIAVTGNVRHENWEFVGTIYSINGGRIMNNIHNKVFSCPKCTNKTLYPVNGNEDVAGIGYHDVCVCDECGAELWSEPQYDNTVKFVDIPEEE